MFSPEFLSGLVAFFLTIFVLLYLIGDMILFRIAVYAFVGVSAGYVASVAWHYVLSPQLAQPLLYGTSDQRLMLLIPAVLVFLLLFKAAPSLSGLGTPSVAFMVGVGTAVAIGGAVTGTLIPQITASINTFDAATLAAAVVRNKSSLLLESIEAILMMIGTVSTLVYFQFTAKRGDDGSYKRNPVTRILSLIGGVFIAITFGVLFAGVYSAALTALIERLKFLIDFVVYVKELWLP